MESQLGVVSQELGCVRGGIERDNVQKATVQLLRTLLVLMQTLAVVFVLIVDQFTHKAASRRRTLSDHEVALL
jgi:hypothetical protein